MLAMLLEPKSDQGPRKNWTDLWTERFPEKCLETELSKGKQRKSYTSIASEFVITSKLLALGGGQMNYSLVWSVN